jgi:hypothetical protein
LASRKKSRLQWYRADLHLHTPASADYHSPETRYIDLLRKADQRGLDIIAFTDHNTVNGYAAMMSDIERLEYLESLGRAQAEELRLLADYRRLLDKILVLPGFEFTATFGFHIIGIFSPQTTIRQIEHLLLGLNIPPAALDEGSSQVGASADVLTAYRAINEAGGICIAAHANTTHGVAMRGMDFGGQTRIAYTQDRNLHALEVTDLGRKGRSSTQHFFSGAKPEYPRRMRCIQGSDSHNPDAIRDKGRVITLGIGERVTEFQLQERSFEALLAMFQSNDYSRSRSYNPDSKPEDYILVARQDGPSIVQSFHENMTRKGENLHNIIADVCAFANTNGGAVYVGVSPDKNKNPIGVSRPKQAIETLQAEIHALITPLLKVDIDTHETQGKTVIRIQVPFGEDRPYAIDNAKIYVREDDETSIAFRDELVDLVRQGMTFNESVRASLVEAPPPPAMPEAPAPPKEDEDDGVIKPPRAGVEIVGAEQRGDAKYYIMRDLRNGSIVKNVTRSSARRLWAYAIKQMESNPVLENKVDWKEGGVGLWRTYRKGGNIRYDLVQKINGNIRVYYGATENGMNGQWRQFLAPEDQT